MLRRWRIGHSLRILQKNAGFGELFYLMLHIKVFLLLSQMEFLVLNMNNNLYKKMTYTNVLEDVCEF